MGASSCHCGDFVVGLCESGVESVGLGRLQLLSSSSLWLAFFCAVTTMILSVHTTGSPGGGGEGGNVKVDSKT